MYLVSRLTEQMLDNHIGVLSRITPNYYGLTASSLIPSADLIRRAIFYSGEHNQAFLVADSETNRIMTIILLGQYNADAKSMSVFLMSLNDPAPDPKLLSEIIGTVVSDIMETLELNSVRSSVVSFEKEHLATLQLAGFENEAIMNEQIFTQGSFHDVYMNVRFRNNT